jgi:hypothetical protein
VKREFELDRPTSISHEYAPRRPRGSRRSTRTSPTRCTTAAAARAGVDRRRAAPGAALSRRPAAYYRRDLLGESALTRDALIDTATVLTRPASTASVFLGRGRSHAHERWLRRAASCSTRRCGRRSTGRRACGRRTVSPSCTIAGA